jgi:hypothetical protein
LKTSNNIETAGKTLSPWRVAVAFAIVMSIFVYMRLASEGFILALLLIVVGGVLQVVGRWKSSSRMDIAFDAVSTVVLVSVILHVYHRSLTTYVVLFFTTIFYRPGYLHHGNRRLALIVSLVIAGVVLPVTCGFVSDPSLVQVASGLYALLVLSLWIFCSKFGAGLFAD